MQKKAAFEIWPEGGDSRRTAGQEIIQGIRVSSISCTVAVISSYRIVPYMRGRERSRKPEKKSGEVKFWQETGKRDNSGQNVNSCKGCGETDKSISLDLIYMLSRDRRDRAHTI